MTWDELAKENSELKNAIEETQAFLREATAVLYGCALTDEERSEKVFKEEKHAEVAIYEKFVNKLVSQLPEDHKIECPYCGNRVGENDRCYICEWYRQAKDKQ